MWCVRDKCLRMNRSVFIRLLSQTADPFFIIIFFIIIFYYFVCHIIMVGEDDVHDDDTSSQAPDLTQFVVKARTSM